MATRSTAQQRNFSKNSQNKRPGKKQLPEPTHLGHFVSILIMSVCKKFLHIDTSVKIGVYVCGVLIGSVLSDIIALPKSYVSDKRNIFNRVFVSFGFGWTLLLLTAYIFLTSFVITCGNVKLIFRKHLLRLAIATFWWYALTKTFNYVDAVVGVCSLSSVTKKYDCLKAGRAWLGFDISGHVFLLMHNLLTISEEVKSFKSWTHLDSLLKEEDLSVKRNLSERQLSQAREYYKMFTPVIKVIIFLLTLWTIFCEFMLIISVIYRFHTLSQKVTAAILSVGCWFMTYRVLLHSPIFPEQSVAYPPGYSQLNYMK